MLKKLLNEFNIKYTTKIVKENYKYKYINKHINTFPQVYYNYKTTKILIGGYTDFFNILNYILEKKDVKKIPLKATIKNKIRIYTFILKQLRI